MKGMYPGGAPVPQEARATFDPDTARARMGVGLADFSRLFDIIWREVVERRDLLDEAWKSGNLKQVALHAHTIKSSTASIGAERLSRAAAAVESAANCGDARALTTAMEGLQAAKEALSILVGMDWR